MTTPKCNVQSYSWDLGVIVKCTISSDDKIKLKILSVTIINWSLLCFALMPGYRHVIIPVHNLSVVILEGKVHFLKIHVFFYVVLCVYEHAYVSLWFYIFIFRLLCPLMDF